MAGSQKAHIEMELPCTLTDVELQSRGRMLGETIWEIDETQAARTEAMKGFKERLVGLNEQQRKLARIIKNRMEDRMTMCVVTFHTPIEGMKQIVRVDTGEIVRDEQMTDAERQLNLFASQKEFEQFMRSQEASGNVDRRDGDPPKEAGS